MKKYVLEIVRAVLAALLGVVGGMTSGCCATNDIVTHFFA